MNRGEIRKVGLPLLNLVRLRGVPILQQLHLEERLLRTCSDNWCIINDGTNHPTIVMGASGKKHLVRNIPLDERRGGFRDGSYDECEETMHSKRYLPVVQLQSGSLCIYRMQGVNVGHMNLFNRKPAELLEINPVLRDKIPVIRRFSGGGTVIVDEGTIFVTFICNKEAVPGLQPYPQPIMSWSSLIYSKVFQGIADFNLREHDYVLGTCKFGGNAQSITKNRWVHHTSFLWDYEVRNMYYLKLPKRAPNYRQARGHLEFICRMKDYLPRSDFIDKTIMALDGHFTINSMKLEAIEFPKDSKFSPSSKILGEQELEEAACSMFQPEVAVSELL